MEKCSILIYSPVEFNTVVEMTDQLKTGKAIIINLSFIRESRQRVVDFMIGATYAINGTSKKIDDEIILCTPRNLIFQAYPYQEEEE